MPKGIIKILTIILFCITFASCHSDSIKDIDGNSYKTVVIDSTTWMAENLRTTRYNDGAEIPQVKDNDKWANLTTPGFSWYNNDPENIKTYGGLYNWYAVETNKLCPAGWHVSTDADWSAIFIEGGNNLGGKLKESGTAHWRTPNTGATNERGFNGRPGGYRSFEGAFSYISISGYWWTSTPYNETTVLFWDLRYKSPNMYKYRSEKNCGFSVRCVKDK